MSEYFYGEDESARPSALERLRARMAGWAERLAPRRAASAAQPDGAPPDPAKLLFPVQPDAASGERVDADRPLRARLEESAENIAGYQKTLRARAGEVWRAVVERRDGFARNVAYYLRVLIGIALAGVALHLDRASLTDGMTIFGPMSVSEPNHAAIVSAVFFWFGALLATGGLIGLLFVSAAGDADNRKVQARARRLGGDAAAIALRIDAALAAAREEMDRHHARNRPARAVGALSQAHLIALEAATLFRTLGVLNDRPGEPADEAARRRFAEFLRESAAPEDVPQAGAFFAVLAALAIGFAFGYGFAYVQFVPGPESPEQTDAASLLKLYPAAAHALLGAGLIYALLGWICGQLRFVIAADARRQALVEALDAARSPFTGENAPRMDDIAQRIEDALAVYIAWVEPPPGKPKTGAAAAAAEDDAPAWRRPPEGPRFVETGFQAAPKAFRADPPDRDSEKKSRRGTGPKRTLKGLVRPPGI
ncbi:hypothetical protein [Amphiplicatus metriothermophilus]|uniref:Uncharacterized protein n=1 Tax=Amphiplicatus metriothermophilus TaxID=1519374 RepID=A0A239PWW1_9PROT|nr:hypothetical protein [Amphiplicatus metriothermophilus]MBB5518942.1 hypothetical protein [Amphiplicatus metriothermophilus]SNT74513.1 hypothetical protein SAMN06297382_2220 [Amphiplicatus metriothermophilus]